MSPKNQRRSRERKLEPAVLANRDGLKEEMRSWIEGHFDGRPCCFVCVSEGALPGHQVFDIGEQEFSRALIVIERNGAPVSTGLVLEWRDWAMGRNVWELRMAVVEGQLDKEAFEEILLDRCAGWNAEVSEAETPAIKAGQFVSLPDEPTPKDDPSLLTLMFGSMGELLSRLEVTARRFKKACHEGGLDADVIKKYLESVDKLLQQERPPEPGKKSPSLGLENLIDHFPKVLLFGESGVGKTLIASYLQSRTGLVQGRPRRIPIPEYLGKEDAFEFDMFGYAHGAYTGGREDGEHGLLLGHIGGVVFLDEIGEANPTVQAKLLAFLDDYRVRPRGWGGSPLHCPVLVVAATNKDLDEMVKDGSFRGDLLRRFTDRLTIPPLRERIADIQFILDCLLQRDSLNPGGRITEIGEGALEAVKVRDFKDGNFRELEDLFRAACELANREGRHFLVAGDFC